MKRKKTLKKIVLITAVMVVIGVAKSAVAGGIILVGPPPMPMPIMPMPIMMPAPIPFPPPPVFVVGPPTPVPMPVVTVQPQPQVIIIRVIKQCPCHPDNNQQVNNLPNPQPTPPSPNVPTPNPVPSDTGEMYNTYLAAPQGTLTQK